MAMGRCGMSRRIVNLLVGAGVFCMCLLVLPNSIFSSFESKAAVGTVAWMAYWWVTSPVDYAVTAFLPVVLNAFFQITDMSSVLANYASETIMLLLGASILTVAWERTGLDKRIASFFLRLVGGNVRHQLVFWFMLSMMLSTVLPNAVVCATVTPIAVSMLEYAGHGDIGNSKIGSKILITIAYATGIGGLASPLGGAMNLVIVEYVQELTGQEYMYTSWVIRFIPIMLVLIISNILFMLRDVKKNDSLGESKEYFLQQYNNLPVISLEEKVTLALFLATTILSFTRQLYAGLLPGLKPAYVFLTCAMVSFLITNRDGERLMVWKSVQKKVIWEMIYIFAGGLAAGTLINKSGAASDIGTFVASLNLTGGFITVCVIVMLTVLLSDITSNTATAAVAIPIVISIMQGIGINPIPYVYVAAVGVNLSYMFPTSIRAIPVGYGLSPKYMFKEGWKITILMIALMSVVCTLMLKTWIA
jgi:sodium-dependent dicarboxylate transporter 2/3/5